MNMFKQKTGFILLALLFIPLLSGCTVARNVRYSSSVVEYLYPSKTEVMEKPGIPTLELPLKIGIAFVPENRTMYSRTLLGEKQKLDLMDRISSEFKKYPFVKSIEPIPSAYLTPAGSFANVDQIRTMYGIDVIALISCDQIQHTDQGLLSIAYWTIVGMYIVRGEKNDTNTMLDAAVYHIPSRKMLFRAPGASHVLGTATPINLTEQLRNDSLTGFEQAADSLTANLQEQLARFKENIKATSGQSINIVRSPGYTGGGSIDAFYALILLALAGSAFFRGRK
jgi:rhombotail lipoprotein